ncbi:M3 family metallopeptidase [Acidipila sp. EB88]|uniref:M3 family metallopeptidase n=1 Tax=Acidipila sp. EB88 TaxID=2305226 RepID=UPI000F60255B|nr:M3 family metallopeptidase [Acidipila sp. EB88]RRA47714.1 peptidase M3 [Acidipila sp. EB88]
MDQTSQLPDGRTQAMRVPASTGLSHPWLVASAPALESWVAAALDQHARLVDGVTDGNHPRTLEHTLRRYDDAVAVLSAAGSQLSLLNSVHPDKSIRDTAQAQLQLVAQAGVALGLNRAVYQALGAIPMPTDDPATAHYLDRTLLGYRLAGVDREEAVRDQLRALQEQATMLSLTFGRNVQESVGTVIVESPEELAGLPEDFVASHPARTEGEHTGSIVLTTEFPDYLPVMTFATNAALRRRMFLAYQTRAFPHNVPILQELLKVRGEIAALLGFSTWADLATADQMMESSAKMQQFLDELEVATRQGAEREYALLLGFAQQAARAAGVAEPAAIDAASRGFWMEQYRRAEFAFDSQAVRPYFPFARVQSGVLSLVEAVFGVRFEPVDDAEVWHPSVTTWDVWDRRGGNGRLGRFYLDMHPREGKDKWFSAAPLIPGILGQQLPEAALICNFPEPKDGNPGLLQHSDVSTYLHEFGHLMHAILGGQQRWAGNSGIATEGDFVEVPSQMLEEFFRDPGLLARFAHHYQTDEPIPEALVERMNRASAFGRADSVRTQLFYTSYSLDTHRLDPATLDLEQLLEADYKRFLPYEWVDGNKLHASFTHLTGYSSNYYTYLFDKVIAIDFFREFATGDLLAEEVTTRYRKEVLEPGGSRPGRQLVRNFLRRDQNPEAFSEWLAEAIPADGTPAEALPV